MRFPVPPGATPIEATDELIAPGVKNYADLCAVEAENILEASGRHLSRRKNPDARWLDEPFIRRVHRDMFDRVWRWAGRYRQTELTIGVPPQQVAEEIGKLVGDARYWSTLASGQMPVLERAVRIHHRLAFIRPFPNGNGRHARLVADIYLHARRCPLPRWPDGGLAAQSAARTRYLRALRAADRGDFGPLTRFAGAL